MMKNFKLGILGSGQLGRMTVQAAANYGISCHVFAPDVKDSPACLLYTSDAADE